MDLSEQCFKDQQAQSQLVAAVIQYAREHGVLTVEKPETAPIVAPCTVLPSPTPRKGFQTVLGLQPLVNTLVDKMARDHDFIVSSLGQAAEVDPFTHRLLQLYNSVRGKYPDRYRSEFTLGVLRNDFMLQCPEGTDFGDAKLLQVECNTISASFAMLSSRVTNMHREVLKGVPDIVAALPVNSAETSLPEAFKAAHDVYMEQRVGADQRSHVQVKLLLVVQPDEFNTFDQDILVQQLKANHGLDLIKMPFLQLKEECRLTADGALLHTSVTGEETEFSVIYYRAGYAPTDYKSEDEWTCRAMLEESVAVKCPNAAYHLVGSKKIQQVLANEGVLEKFLSHEDAERMRLNFAGLYSLDPAEYTRVADRHEIVAKAIAAPQDYVLKPQREGGGNNLYDAELAHALRTLSERELNGFILMERIKPPLITGVLLPKGKSEGEKCPVTTEIGVYGAIVTNGSQERLNQACGHLLRTKRADSNEAGVAAGLGHVDSPYLV